MQHFANLGVYLIRQPPFLFISYCNYMLKKLKRLCGAPALVFIILSCATLFVMPAFAQTTAVTGQVIGADGAPLEGVSVVEKGTSNGTATDESGAFSLTVSKPDATLVFSFLGFTGQEKPLAGSREVTVILEAAGATELEQVVVIGYGTAQKRDLTGSIVTVRAEDIKDQPATNPMNLLQGKVPGLSVVNSGRPGAEPDIRIRGTNTINGVRPVYIVDGILNDNINFLNPADIESMEVLKDPSSLAIFGVRGANGAIAITTKKARAGQVAVNLNTAVGFKHVQDRIKLTTGDQFRELYTEQLANQGANPFDFSNYWTENTDWQDEIFQKGVVNYNNVSISGAGDKNRFYLGVGYTTEEGIIRNETYRKYTVNFSDEFRVHKNIKFGITFNGYMARLPQNRDVGSAVRAAPVGPVRDASTGLFHILPSFQSAQIFNPLQSIEGEKGTLISKEYRAVGSIYADIDFLRDFNFRVQLYEDYGFNTSRSYAPITVFYNPTIPGNDKRDTSNAVTSVSQSQNIYPKTQMDYLLTYKKSFDVHNLTLLGGVTTYYSAYEGTGSSVKQGTGMMIPNDPNKWYVDAVGDQTTRQGSGSAWEDASLSYLFRALYNYDRKYLINASFRRDGSSQFYRLGNQWKNFGAIGLGWVVSNEDFFGSSGFFDYMKLKGSWGVLGNKNIPDAYRYPAYPTLSNANSAVFGDNIVAALEPQYIPDPNLNWETVHSWEAGVEATFLDNKMHVEANYYHKLTKDILTLIQGPSGTRPGLGNLGEIENKGIELLATYQGNINRALDFRVSGNITTISNKVIKLNKEGFEIISGPSRTTAGHPIGYFYGYKVVGVYQSNADVSKSPENTLGAANPGDLKFADITGDGKITVEDRTMIGNPTPDFTYGGNISFTFKNALDLSIDLQGVYGNEIFRTWNQNPFTTFNYQVERLNRWQGAGTSNWEPILDRSRSLNTENSSYWIEDGSYFRIRNVQLGYSFPNSSLSRMGIKSVRLYVNAQNLWTFTNSTGFTPEIGGSATSFGIDNGTYPVPAIYTAGLNLNF